MLKLYHWNRSGHSAIALLCLHAKGLPFESARIDLLALEQYSAAFLAISASGEAPVLVHDSTAITQTSALTEYLEETFPEPALMPTDPVARWKARVWAKILNEDISPSVSLLGWHRYTRPRFGEARLAQLREQVERIPIIERREVWRSACAQQVPSEQLLYSQRKLEAVLRRMETELSHGPWLAGPVLSLADIQLYPMIAPIAELLPQYLNRAATPHIGSWLDRMRALPTVEQALGSPTVKSEELLHFAPGPEHIRWG
jgi:glutathione S-transferase